MSVSPELASVFLVIFLLVTTVQYVYTRFMSRSGLPEDIPWIGVDDDGYLSRARATLRSFLGTRGMVLEGYTKYSKNGLPFVLPNVATGPEVIIPMSQMDWLLKQPDSVLNQHEVNVQFLQAHYTMLHPRVITETVHEDVIAKEMTKLVSEFTRDVQEEVDFAFRKTWGVNTKEWTEVVAYNSMSDIISRISTRIIVGLPLCRNEEFLGAIGGFARLVTLQAAAIAMIPKSLKPLIAPIINILDYRRYFICRKYVVPIIKQRNAAKEKPVANEKGGGKGDYIQWSIDRSYINNDPSERTVDIISKRLTVMGFAVIQSSAITLTNLALDLAASPLISAHLETIRNEVLTELTAENGVWNKPSLARMVTLDSFIRESMRLWGFVSRGVLKEVVAKNGITLPSGHHLSKGTKVGVHGYPVHHDQDIYGEHWKFDPFRFVSLGEDGKKKGVRLETTSASFMGFSHGRHACPGRFFAAQQLKLVLAYIALNYDIHPIPTRPENDWFIGSQGPPLRSKIHIRRREGTV